MGFYVDFFSCGIKTQKRLLALGSWWRGSGSASVPTPATPLMVAREFPPTQVYSSRELHGLDRSPLSECLICYYKVCRYSGNFAAREVFFYRSNDLLLSDKNDNRQFDPPSRSISIRKCDIHTFLDPGFYMLIYFFCGIPMICY